MYEMNLSYDPGKNIYGSATDSICLLILPDDEAQVLKLLFIEIVDQRVYLHYWRMTCFRNFIEILLYDSTCSLIPPDDEAQVFFCVC